MGGRPLRRAASTTIGINKTSPTSKKTGMPTRMPSTSSAQGMPFGPQLSTNARPSAAPAPELARSCPRIAPMPRMMAIWPIISPAPAVKARGTFQGECPRPRPVPGRPRTGPVRRAAAAFPRGAAGARPCRPRKPAGRRHGRSRRQGSRADYRLRPRSRTTTRAGTYVLLQMMR